MLDVPNLIDFMLVWTMGNSESEFRAAGSLENGEGFKFFIKDADGYLRNPNRVTTNVTHNGPLNAMTTFRNEGRPGLHDATRRPDPRALLQWRRRSLPSGISPASSTVSTKRC